MVQKGAQTELSTLKKKQNILNDMGQLHYMLTKSVFSILCEICYRTSVGPLCERTEELHNARRMWQFSF